MTLSKFLNKLITILLLVMLPCASYAQQIENFEPIGGVTIKLNGNTFKGVLFSEEERLRYLRLEIAYNEISEKYENLSVLYKETRQLYDSLYQKTIELGIEQIKYLDKIEEEVSKPQSFYEEHKSVIYFTIGIMLTSVIFVSYESVK